MLPVGVGTGVPGEAVQLWRVPRHRSADSRLHSEYALVVFRVILHNTAFAMKRGLGSTEARLELQMLAQRRVPVRQPRVLRALRWLEVGERLASVDTGALDAQQALRVGRRLNVAHRIVPVQLPCGPHLVALLHRFSVLQVSLLLTISVKGPIPQLFFQGLSDAARGHIRDVRLGAPAERALGCCAHGPDKRGGVSAVYLLDQVCEVHVTALGTLVRAAGLLVGLAGSSV